LLEDRPMRRSSNKCGLFNSLDSRHIHKPNVRPNPFREQTPLLGQPQIGEEKTT